MATETLVNGNDESPVQSTRPVRPSFSSTVTSDRLAEAARRPSIHAKKSSGRAARKSYFIEVGLQDENEVAVSTPLSTQSMPMARPNFNASRTSDRLAEAAMRPSFHSKRSSESAKKKSAFLEIGLDDVPPNPDATVVILDYNTEAVTEIPGAAIRRSSAYSQEYEISERRSVFSESRLLDGDDLDQPGSGHDQEYRETSLTVGDLKFPDLMKSKLFEAKQNSTSSQGLLQILGATVVAVSVALLLSSLEVVVITVPAYFDHYRTVW